MIGTGKPELVNQVIETYSKDNDQLVDQILSILYWFRGSLTREDVWQLTPYEREKHLDFINKRFKDAGDLIKKQIPVFI